jgi:hypothetical protein
MTKNTTVSQESRMTKSQKSQKIVFRRSMHLGALAAEQDSAYLADCFIDTGDLGILRNTDDHRCILIGRTGAGKTALRNRLLIEEERVIELNPESLALTYLSNSGVLRFFSSVGVKLDRFYRLLWRHICCIELIKACFSKNGTFQRGFLDDILAKVSPVHNNKKKAVKYVEKFDRFFFQDTEHGVRHVTSTVESQLQGSVAANINFGMANADLNAAKGRSLSSEVKEEFRELGQRVVDQQQIHDLDPMMDVLAEHLQANQQKRYYIIIDQLDTDWIDDEPKLQLIRALIDTAIQVTSKMGPVKVIVAIRQDLMERVLSATRSSGQQEEKYRSSTLEIRWTRKNLIQVIDSRISHLFKSQYTRDNVTHTDILPNKIGNQKAIDYVLERTLERPRDIIEFLNQGIIQAEGKPEITAQHLREAEGKYSRERLASVADEWGGIYPKLQRLVTLALSARPREFLLSDILDEQVEELVLALFLEVNQNGFDAMSEYINAIVESEDWDECRIWLAWTLYKVGIVGLKTQSYQKVSWSYQGQDISQAEITGNTKVHIHKTFWRTLGIHERVEGE